jgi:hypothetical protein
MLEFGNLKISERDLEQKLKEKIMLIIDKAANERVSVYIEDKVLVHFLSKSDIKHLANKYNVKIFEDESKLKFLINGLK